MPGSLLAHPANLIIYVRPREFQIFDALEAKDMDARQAIANQLYLLEKSGFATKNVHGWKWKE